MVFIITGTAESDRRTVGRLLAETLGWEFIAAENLHPFGNFDAQQCNTSLANANPTFHIEILSTAINFWIYEWRDVVVSCPMLPEKHRSQFSRMSSLVKIVCLEASHATGRTPALDRPVRIVSSELPAVRSGGEPGQGVLTLDSSRQVEELVAEITTVLTMRKSPWFAHN